MNLPPGLTHSHPHWNPPTCHDCGEVAHPGEECPACGAYQPTDDDLADEAADRAYEALREER